MKTLVVEDRADFGRSLRAQLVPLGVPADWLTHPEAATQAPSMWSSWSLVLLDALDLSSQQDDHTVSRMGSLDVLEKLRVVPGDQRPRVLVYSTDMARPEVNITARSWGVVDGCYALGALVRHLRAIVIEGDRGHETPGPIPDDWRRLHPKLAVGVDLGEIHQLMRRNERVWRQVWRRDAPFDRAAMMWIRRNILPSLGPDTGYRAAIDVTRRIAGLPYGRMR